MMRMRLSGLIKKIIIYLNFFVPVFICNAQEAMTLANYYPSPFGAYSSLRLYPTTDIVATSSCSVKGEMFYHDTDNKIYACDGANWKAIGSSYWALTGNTIHPLDPGWNVGFRIAAPQQKLSILSFSSLFLGSDTTQIGVNIEAGGSGEAALELKNTTVSSSWRISALPSARNHHLAFQYGTTSIMEFTPQGTLGVFTNNPDTDYKLDVNGRMEGGNIGWRQLSPSNCISSGTNTEKTCQYNNFILAPKGDIIIDCSAADPAKLLSCTVQKIERQTNGWINLTLIISTQPSAGNSETISAIPPINIIYSIQ